MTNSVSINVQDTLNWQALKEKRDVLLNRKVITYNTNEISTSDAARALPPRSALDDLIDDRPPVWMKGKLY
jgi:hypothetical protein